MWEVEVPHRLLKEREGYKALLKASKAMHVQRLFAIGLVISLIVCVWGLVMACQNVLMMGRYAHDG